MKRDSFVTVYLWPLAAFLVPLALYLRTLAPSVTFYDSGEFITAIHYLGSAHSPGYPLFLLFAKPFTWLPFGSIAFRVNLATAFSAALACLSVYLLLRELLSETQFCTENRYSLFARNSASLAGAFLFAASPRLWLQTNHDKPYPLMSLLVALTFLSLLRWQKQLKTADDSPVWFYLVGFIAGVATGAHQTIILFVPAWLLFVVFCNRGKSFKLKELVITLAAAIAGACVQLYLPFRASTGSMQNWGDTSSLSRFLWHLLRRGYPEESHGRDLALVIKQLSAFSIPHEYGWVGFLLFFAGVLFVWRINRPLVVAFAASLIFYWAVLAGVFNPQPESVFLTEEFYTPLYLLSAVIVAAGLYNFASIGASASETPESYGTGHYLLVFMFFMILPIFQVFSNYKDNDQHLNYIAHDYAVNSLRPLPENAVFFTWGDSGAFPLWYLQGVERLREDLDVPHIPHLAFSWYRKELPRMNRYFSANEAGTRQSEVIFAETVSRIGDSRPVMLDYSTRHSIEMKGVKLHQYGILFMLRDPLATPGFSGAGIWDGMALHRFSLANPWEIDSDTEKAIMIMGHSLLQSAEAAGESSDNIRALMLLAEVDRVVPAWKVSVENLRNRYTVK